MEESSLPLRSPAESAGPPCLTPFTKIVSIGCLKLEASTSSSWVRHNWNKPIKPSKATESYERLQGILKGKYHCTIDLLFGWFRINSLTTDNICFYLQNRLIQTSQTGGQGYSDISPFSIPWHLPSKTLAYGKNLGRVFKLQMWTCTILGTEL